MIHRDHVVAARVQSVPLFRFRHALFDHKNLAPYFGKIDTIRPPVGTTHAKCGFLLHGADYNQRMKSLWRDDDAARCASELALRAYGSRLLGGDASLVLHGGGNTSIKLDQNGKRVLYVKATGSDLARVDETAFTPLWVDGVERLLDRESLDNAQMMRELEACYVHARAARPSIETLMHAALPFQYVEHTHADAVLAAMNVEEMETVHAQIYGERAPLVPYQHSGHALARACLAVFRSRATPRSIGLILAFHGVVAFGNNAKSAYENMIELVSRAEHYLHAHGATEIPAHVVPITECVPAAWRTIHACINDLAGKTLTALAVNDAVVLAFARRPDLANLSQQGPATPQHAAYTRRVPLIDHDVEAFARRYRVYLETHLGAAAATRMDPAPRIALDPQAGLCAFGTTQAEARMAAEMYYHDIAVMTAASAHGHYRSAPQAAIALAEFEYGGYATRLRDSSS